MDSVCGLYLQVCVYGLCLWLCVWVRVYVYGYRVLILCKARFNKYRGLPLHGTHFHHYWDLLLHEAHFHHYWDLLLHEAHFYEFSNFSNFFSQKTEKFALVCNVE